MHRFLDHLPINCFGITLGCCGYANFLLALQALRPIPKILVHGFFATSLISFLVLLCLYAAKWIKYPKLVQFEAKQPTRQAVYFIFLLILLVKLKLMHRLFSNKQIEVVLWYMVCIVQVMASGCFYTSFVWPRKNGIFKKPHVSNLMSCMGWLLLSTTASLLQLGIAQDITLYIGLFMIITIDSCITISICRNTSNVQDAAILLLIAPIAEAGEAIRLKHGVPPAQIILYMDTALLILLVAYNIQFMLNMWQTTQFGRYWYYTFPLSTLAGSLVNVANQRQTMDAFIVAGFVSILATIAIMIAIIALIQQMTFNCFLNDEFVIVDPITNLFKHQAQEARVSTSPQLHWHRMS